jgi:UDP-N-acetylmuramate dehydrogenase
MMAAEQKSLRGEVRVNELMSKHTSWRVGGPAESFFVPSSLDDLSTFLHDLHPEIPVFWFGVGSNLLVRDGGIRGVVISASKILKDLDRVENYRVRAGSGLPCTQLARQCIRWGIGPSEFFAGIPGTVGGALAMNAGAHEYSIAYRSVTGPTNEWFIEAIFRFDPTVTPSMDAMNEMLERRKRTQPLGLPSCGSVFRNPPGDHAARLIEAAGLKGYSIGGAEVSEKHANFIINSDNATATDVEELIEHVRQAVIEKHGVELVHEVRIVGEVAQ